MPYKKEIIVHIIDLFTSAVGCAFYENNKYFRNASISFFGFVVDIISTAGKSLRSIYFRIKHLKSYRKFAAIFSVKFKFVFLPVSEKALSYRYVKTFECNWNQFSNQL